MDPYKPIISVTDDDPAVLDSMQLILERAGYSTWVQSNPRQLLDAGAPVPDLYLLDRQLSGVDGLDACRFLKAQSGTAAVPIIIVSASPHAGRLAADAGADGFIEKPFRSIELLELVASCLAARP